MSDDSPTRPLNHLSLCFVFNKNIGGNKGGNFSLPKFLLIVLGSGLRVKGEAGGCSASLRSKMLCCTNAEYIICVIFGLSHANVISIQNAFALCSMYTPRLIVPPRTRTHHDAQLACHLFSVALAHYKMPAPNMTKQVLFFAICAICAIFFVCLMHVNLRLVIH